ncbi:MAG: hypothetical protein A2163_00770 [Actinobacteria bacterium RBG_13_35_12]|nr:MAG: hypothetical protein A2163_00770 [Actinobacteria bacterium RBG_13_35_12]
MARPLDKNKVKNGYSESVWKSLAVKSLRIGWIEGLMEATRSLCPSIIKTLLIGGLFEDVFPIGITDLNDCLNEIDHLDFKKLCARDTHHGRGYTDQFCDLEQEACTTGKKEGVEIVKELSSKTPIKWMNPRIFNCLYTWYKINPDDPGMKREPLKNPFVSMPNCMIDSHTFEGKAKGVNTPLLLSGHYANHRLIGQRVMKEGWDNLREEMFN